MNIQELLADGDRRRDVGIAIASLPKASLVVQGQYRLISAMLDNVDGVGTIESGDDDVTLATAFPDSGKWRGAIIRTLVQGGILEVIAPVRALRPSRHGGLVRRCRLVDRSAATKFLRNVEGRFSPLKPILRQPMLPGFVGDPT